MPTVLEGITGPVEMLTYGEAAALLDVVGQTIRVYVKRGLLHPIRLSRTAEYPEGTPFLLREELAWYDRRRRLGTRHAGPNPYAERYAELLATGAAVVPLLAGADAQLAGQLDTHTPSSGAELIREDTGALAWAGLAILLIVILLALFLGRQPDAGKVAQLRAAPGAGRLPRALRDAADLLDTAA